MINQINARKDEDEEMIPLLVKLSRCYHRLELYEDALECANWAILIDRWREDSFICAADAMKFLEKWEVSKGIYETFGKTQEI